MITEHSKPVILLTFANARDDRVLYLRNLPQEARWLRLALRRAERARLCQLVERSNATLGDILDVFQDPEYRNRIAVFHYGGHANGYQLLLESASGHSAVVDAGGLAAFLGQQRGLQLVFLNACSTEPQMEELLEAGVAAVLVTWRAVDDEVAKEFAGRFYVGLAGGAELQTAYEEAAGAIRAAYGSSTQAMWWVEAEEGETAEDCWPWRLYVREGAQVVETWNLPDAAGNPLFGLPPLPEGDLPGSPFRHLHWFEREHADVFFGRGRQIRDVYRRVTSPGMAPIILLYGQSGVGKSSLLAAGLLPRLEASHAIRYLRRDQEQGLLGTLEAALHPEAAIGDTSEVLDLARAWLAHEEELGRPLLVILDQVEEVYTRPQARRAHEAEHGEPPLAMQDHVEEDNNRPQAASPHELAEFLEALQAIFPNSGPRPQGRLILGFRKEWLAEIANRLEDHKLYYNEVFLEPLDRNGIIEAVNGPARSEKLRMQYGLTIAEGLPELIADDLLQDPDSPVAPILQILLTKLWQRARERDRTRPHFDLELYLTLKREGILLGDFLDQQLDGLKEWHADVVDTGLALDLLAFHTTPLGTAEKRKSDELEYVYRHQEAVLLELVRQCQDRYLLSDASLPGQTQFQATRLCHDTLAPLVRARFDESDRPGQRARRILDNRAPDWEDERQGTPLDEPDLALVEAGAPGMQAWTPTEERLVEASRDHKARRSRMRRVWQGIGAAAMVVIVFMAAIALLQWQSAAREARLNKARELAALAINRLEEDPEESILLAIRAVTTTLETNGEVIPEAEQALHQAVQASRVRQTLRGHEEAVYDIALSPDGRWLATASLDHTARIWDLAAADPARASYPLSNTTYVSAVAFNPDGTRLAVANAEGQVQMWDTSRGMTHLQTMPVLSPHTNWILDMAFSPDGRFLATSSTDGEIKLLDAETGEEANRAEFDHRLCGLAFSRSGERLAVGGEGGVVKLWTPNTGEIQDHRHSAESNQVCGVAISAVDDALLATGADDGKAQLWKLGAEEPFKTLEDHTNTLTSVAFSPDGERIVTGSADHTAKLWDVASGKLLLTLSGHQNQIRAVAFSPDDGQYLFTASMDTTVKIWDLGSYHQDEIWRVAFSPDGSKLATASHDGTARLWTPSGKQLARFEDQVGVVWDVAFHPDGARLATVGDDGTLRVRDINTGELDELSLKDGPLYAVDFSPNKTHLAAAGEDEVFLLDVETGQVLGSIVAHQGLILAIAFHPGGELFATSGLDGTAALLSINSDEPLKIFPHGQAQGVYDLAFSPDGRQLATAGTDNSVKVWDVETGEELFEITGHDDVVSGVAFSPDGMYLITASADRTARVWDISGVSAGQTIETARLTLEHPDAVNGVAISPSEPLLVTVGADSAVRFFPLLLEIEDMIDLAQTRITKVAP